MRPLVVIRRAFDRTLKELGFLSPSEPPYTYSRQLPNGIVQSFDIEKERSFNRLHFTLAEHDPKGVPVRITNLCDFENLPVFSYTDAESLHAVVQAAFHQFVTYGVRWVEGEDVVTPAIAARRDEHRLFTHARLIGEARHLFKDGALPDAVKRFAEAEVYAPLDEVSRKMVDIARARLEG